MELQGKNILVFGLGVSNIAVIHYLKDCELNSLTVTDLKSEQELQLEHDQVQSLFPEAKFVLGHHNESDFLDADIIIKNASIPSSNPLLVKANSKGISIETDVSLFFKLSPSNKIIGVTGTKGKTTTATAIGDVLQAHQLHVVLAGNMGIPVMGKIEEVTPDTWVVLELSSYMTESLAEHILSPMIAVFTSIFPDHLNRYARMEEYVQAKIGLVKGQNEDQYILLNRDDAGINQWFDNETAPGKLIEYGAEDMHADLPVQLLGRHNRANLAAAARIAQLLELDQSITNTALQDFTSVSHRMERVGERDGVLFINNSAATNPGAFVADLRSVLEMERPVYLLAGGSDKALEFTEMTQMINESNLVKKVALFAGVGTERLLELIDDTKVIGVFDSMPEAFGSLLDTVEGEDGVVFLNPGCASFGVFQNEIDRGDQFKKAVECY